MNIATGETKSIFTLKDRINIKSFKSFGALSEEEYLEKLRKMNLADMHSHAVKNGVRPNFDRKRMTKVLVSEFRKSFANYKVSIAKLDSK